MDDPDQADAKFTIKTTTTLYSTGAKLIVKEWLEGGSKVKKTVVTIIQPAPGGDPGGDPTDPCYGNSCQGITRNMVARGRKPPRFFLTVSVLGRRLFSVGSLNQE